MFTVAGQNSHDESDPKATLFGTISHHTERDLDYQITLKGIQLLLDFWWRIRQRGLRGPPE